MANWHSMIVDDVLRTLGSSVQGLDDVEVGARLKEYGPNELEKTQTTSPLRILAAQFKGLLMIILLAATLTSFVVGETVDALVILSIAVVCAILGFVQEYRAEKSLESLKRMAAPTAVVTRKGEELQVPSREVVPGDIILLRTGDRISADARIIEQFNIKVDEASLTGESVPVRKHSIPVAENASLTERASIVYSGTTVTFGRGKAVVFSTGMTTEFGRIAGMVEAAAEQKTPMENRLEHVGKWLGVSCIAVCVMVSGLGILRGYPILMMLVWGVSLAVAAVPEALPAVVTGALAIGVQRMAKCNAIVRKLPAVETLGCTTVICADKTGTLTRGEMTVSQMYLNDRVIKVTGVGYEPKGEFLFQEGILPDSQIVVLSKAGLLCNDARLEFRNGSWNIIGDPTEGALVVLAEKGGLSQDKIRSEYPRIGEVPFSSDRKLMTTIHSTPQGTAVAYAKGASEMLLARCSHIIKADVVLPLDGQEKQKILDVNERMAIGALRVLALAYRILPDQGESTELTEEYVERDLIFIGLVGIIDPPRKEAKKAIQTCKDAGVRTVMITGDHKLTASAIGQQLGMIGDGDRVFTGHELDQTSDSEFQGVVEDVAVYARVSPEHKLRIIKALKAKGHVVAMTGDGVNDAPALKNADIGVAMGITGTDVAKEASDMILTDDNFASIVSAMKEGREIYDNVKKYVAYLLSCNVGEILVMLIAGLLAWPLPLFAVQLLWVNLTTDGLPALALGVDPSDPNIMKRRPRSPHESLFTQPIKSLIFGTSVMMAAILLPTFNWAYQNKGLPYAQTMIFTTLVMFEMFNAFNCRSERESLLKVGPFSNRWLVVAVAISILMQLTVIYIPSFRMVFDTVALSITDWLIIIPLSSFPLIATELVKLWSRSKADKWLSRMSIQKI